MLKRLLNPGASFLIFLCLSFLICQMKTMIVHCLQVEAQRFISGAFGRRNTTLATSVYRKVPNTSTEGQKTCGINAGAHESRTRDVSCFTRLPDWLNDVGISNFFPWKKAFPLFFFTDSSSIDLRNRASL